MKFNLSQINLGEIMYFNETIVKIVLILLDSLHSQCTDVKTCFLVLWFNCEFRIETDNENINKTPQQSTIFSFQNRTPYIYIFFQRRKGTNVKTLEVYNVKTLEVCNVKH